MLATANEQLPCFHCGYDLRLQPADGNCPECGLIVAHSLAAPRLQFASVGGLRWTRRAVGIAAAAFLVPSAAYLSFLLLTLWMLPQCWDSMADPMSLPASVYRLSGRALTLADIAAAALWFAAVAAFCLPRFPRECAWWRAAICTVVSIVGINAAASIANAVMYLQYGPNAGLALPTGVAFATGLCAGVAEVAAWSVVLMRLPRGWSLTRTTVQFERVHASIDAVAVACAWLVAHLNPTLPAVIVATGGLPTIPAWQSVLANWTQAYWTQVQTVLGLLSLAALFALARALREPRMMRGR